MNKLTFRIHKDGCLNHGELLISICCEDTLWFRGFGLNLINNKNDYYKVVGERIMKRINKI